MKEKSSPGNLYFLIRYCLAGFLIAFLTGAVESFYFLSKNNSSISPNLQTGNYLIIYAGIFYGIIGIVAGMFSAIFSLGMSGLLTKNRRHSVKNILAVILILFFYIKLFTISINPFEKNLITRLLIFTGIIFCTIILLYLFSSLISTVSQLLNVFPKTKKRIFISAIALITSGLLISIISSNFRNRNEMSLPGKIKKPNILLIVMDTTRADHLSCYGYVRKTSPNLDKLASEGVLFNNTFSSASWTFPSHSSIFTGKYPSEHGATYKHLYLDESNTTIAEILSKNGWQTMGFTGNAWITKKVGITQGFSSFDEDVDRLGFIDNTTPLLFMNLSKKIIEKGYDDFIPYKRFIFPNGYRKADEMLPVITKKLQEIRKNKPFFMFINFNDVHGPYEPPEEFNIFTDKTNRLPSRIEFSDLVGKRDIATGKLNISSSYFKHLNDLYDGEILFLDYYLGILFEKMKELELWDNTLVIVTADHGESIGERGLWDHGHSLYTEQVHVPLIIFFNGRIRKNLIINSITETIDIFPTILDFAKIQYNKDYSGSSLKPLIENKIIVPHKEYAFSEIFEDSLYAKNILEFRRNLSSVRDGKNTLISSSNGTLELYNRETDPYEKINLFPKVKEGSQKLKKILDYHIGKRQFKDLKDAPKLDSEMQEKLKALGYIK